MSNFFSSIWDTLCFWDKKPKKGIFCDARYRPQFLALKASAERKLNLVWKGRRMTLYARPGTNKVGSYWCGPMPNGENCFGFCHTDSKDEQYIVWYCDPKTMTERDREGEHEWAEAILSSHGYKPGDPTTRHKIMRNAGILARAAPQKAMGEADQALA